MTYSRILLIDDDDDDQEIFVTALNEISNTIVCITESSAQQALYKLKSKETSPDVIFLDLNMPVMNGFQFLAEVKSNEALKDIPVIILSTSAVSEAIQQTKALGAADFITKPNDFVALKNILQTIFV
jgi:CheY-like chemotaxis protein